MTHWILAALLALHGVAHVVGFLGTWGLVTVEEFDPRALLGGLVIMGDGPARAVGVAWLLLALGFCWGAFGVATQSSWGYRTAVGLCLTSLLLCVVTWPGARVGVLVNLGLLVWLFAAAAGDRGP